VKQPEFGSCVADARIAAASASLLRQRADDTYFAGVSDEWAIHLDAAVQSSYIVI
jgi:hypothetical protein